MDIIILSLFLAACIQSYIRGTQSLSVISTVSMYFMLATIIIGICVAAYVYYTKDQIFDPLNSELDSDPECVEDDEIKLS